VFLTNSHRSMVEQQLFKTTEPAKVSPGESKPATGRTKFEQPRLMGLIIVTTLTIGKRPRRACILRVRIWQKTSAVEPGLDHVGQRGSTASTTIIAAKEIRRAESRMSVRSYSRRVGGAHVSCLSRYRASSSRMAMAAATAEVLGQAPRGVAVVDLGQKPYCWPSHLQAALNCSSLGLTYRLSATVLGACPRKYWAYLPYSAWVSKRLAEVLRSNI